MPQICRIYWVNKENDLYGRVYITSYQQWAPISILTLTSRSKFYSLEGWREWGFASDIFLVFDRLTTEINQ